MSDQKIYILILYVEAYGNGDYDHEHKHFVLVLLVGERLVSEHEGNRLSEHLESFEIGGPLMVID